MSVVFDRAVSFYDRTRGLPPEVEPQLAAVVREQTPLQPGSRVLEIGVGTGRIALPLVRENGYRYVGIDLSRQMMGALRDKAPALPVLLLQADASQLPFPDAAFDAVVAVHVFHLISDWARAMDEVARVLRPGGALLVGFNQHDEGSPVRRLRKQLSELTKANREPRDGRLVGEGRIEQQLKLRFGEPREAATSHWTSTRTARELLEQFEARTWSHTWSIPDELLATAAERGQSWADEQFGSLDAPLIDEQYFVWSIYTRP